MDKKKTRNIVFYVSLLLVVAIALWSVVFNDSFTEVSNAAFTFLTTDFGWLYMAAMIVFLIFAVYIAFG